MGQQLADAFFRADQGISWQLYVWMGWIRWYQGYEIHRTKWWLHLFACSWLPRWFQPLQPWLRLLLVGYAVFQLWLRCIRPLLQLGHINLVRLRPLPWSTRSPSGKISVFAKSRFQSILADNKVIYILYSSFFVLHFIYRLSAPSGVLTLWNFTFSTSSRMMDGRASERSSWIWMLLSDRPLTWRAKSP